ncbi:MAG: SDR family NAD(P)-dependent oxidoreductase [Candidatus Diapherotrites archaeon]
MKNINMKGKKIAVTGANGFVGSAVCEKLLENKCNVSAIIHSRKKDDLLKERGISKELTILKADIMKKNELKKALSSDDFDFCLHFAAQSAVRLSKNEIEKTMKINSYGTWHVLQACVNSEITNFVLASSGKIYGKHKTKTVNEKSALKTTTVYGKSKIFAENIAHTFQKSHNLSVAITRSANIYGPYDNNFSRIIPSSMNAILQGTRPVILGRGKAKRDFIFIDDVSDAYLKIMQFILKNKNCCETFNIATQKQTSISEIVKLASDASGSRIKPEFKKADSKEEDENVMSIAKARKLLDWTPEYTLKKGLRETFYYYKRCLK